MAKTEENLKTAFAGESQANQKYRAFAKKADAEGFSNVARLFRAAAEAERIHAEAHLAALEGVRSTAENLEEAISGETYEYTKMYPPMLTQAESEGSKAKRGFTFALKAEEVHARLYKAALDAIKSNKDVETEFYLCPVCGHITAGKPTEACPICGVKAEKYVLV